MIDLVHSGILLPRHYPCLSRWRIWRLTIFAATAAADPADRVGLATAFGADLLHKATRGDGPYRKNVDYDSTLWRKALHKAFPNRGGKRTTVFTTASHVRSLRNRTAHHEPLIDGVPLPGQTDRRGNTRRLTLAEVLRLVEYIDQGVATWLGQTSHVPELLRTRP
ncbi:hypothetical protein ACIPPJ_30090 [Streptomyces sp. NPDC086091]|uniref:hypothetical protein n=1 Tax=Streptomyces sp. NPDC086091 TaxID=3365751 RepID=UPI0038099828